MVLCLRDISADLITGYKGLSSGESHYPQTYELNQMPLASEKVDPKVRVTGR